MRRLDPMIMLRCIATAAFLFAWPIPAMAQDAELVAAAKAVAQKGAAAPAAQRALIIARNKDFQRLSLKGGDIPADVFEKCQGWYVDTMTRYAEEEAQKLGIKVTRQLAPAKVPKPGQKFVEFQPGTDLDLITDATTPEQITNLQKGMNDRIAQEVRDNLPNAPHSSSWVHSNDIDLMADPVRTTPENFKKICDQNNFAYERPGAARFEAWKRTLEDNPATAKPVNFDDLADYLDEMKSTSARRGEQIAGIQSELRKALRHPDATKAGTEAWKHAQQLEADLYITQAQQSKLVERINDATDTMLKQYPVPEGTVIQGSSITKHGKVRDAASRPYSPGLAHELNEEMLQDAYKRNAEALAAIAKNNPEAAEACADQIRKTSRNLTPKQKAELVDHIRAVHGDDAAEAMKGAIFGQAPADGLTSLGGKASGPYTIRSTSATAREAAQDFSAAMAAGRPRDAMTAIEDMHANMKKARDLASLPGGAANTGLEEFVDEFSKIRAAAAKLPYSQQSAFIEAELKKLMSQGGFGGRLADAVKTGAREADLLQVMAGERDAMRKAVIREMLEGKPGASQELWEKISSLSEKVPVMHILTAVFVYFDTVSAAQLQGEGKADEAARKALEALAGALGSPVLGVVTVIGNLIIDAAKDAGYSIATNPQDMDDLLAGIISVKGWESAEGFGVESSIDKLAMGFVTEDEVKRAVENAIARAAANSSDTPEVLAGKKKALMDTMLPKILTAWRARREEFVKDFLALLPALDELMGGITLQIECTPDPVPLLKRKTGQKSGSGTVRIAIDGPMEDIRSIAADLEARLRKLGGYRHVLYLSVRQKVSWTLDGKNQPELRAFGLSPVLLEKPLLFRESGPHTIACQVTWELVPVSGITDGPDYRGKTFVLNPIKNSSYKADTGLKIDWQMPGFKDTFTPGDVVSRHAGKMTRTYSRTGEGSVEVVDRGEDDSVAVTIAGKTQVLPDETAVLTPEYNCAEAVDTTDLAFRWSGPVKSAGDTAFFQQAKPGPYEVGLTVFRGRGRSAIKLADALPVVIQVLRPDDADFALSVTGPRRARINEDIRLRVKTSCGNTAAEKLLEDRNVWIEWHVNGQPFDTSDSLLTSATMPGTYAFDVRLVWHGEGNDRLLASTAHTIEVEGPERPATPGQPDKSKPNAPGTGAPDKTGSGKGSDRGDGSGTKNKAGTAGAPGTKPGASGAAPGASGGGSYSMAGVPGGAVFYGSSVGLTFAAPAGAKKGTSAADAAFFEAVKNQEAAYKASLEAEDAARKAKVKQVEDAMRQAQESKDNFISKALESTSAQPPSSTPVQPPPPAAPAGWGKTMDDIWQTDKNPVANEHPDASWMNGDGTPPAPAAPAAPAPPPPPPPPPGPLRFVFQSSPTVSFSPVESDNGATTVTFDRMGEVKIWAEVFTNASAPPFVTPQAIYQVKGPPLTILCAPEGAKIGEEARGQVTASPAIPDSLVNYYWSAPPSSERMEYSGNSDRIGFMPRNANPIPLRVEARSPYYNDIIGSASATYQPSVYTVEAQVVGRTGPNPMVWSTAHGGLIPAPSGTYIVDEAVRVRATLTGEPKPDPLRWNWTVNGGTTLRSSGLGDEITVSRSEPGTATATVTAKDKNNSILGTATASFPVSPNEPPPPLTVKLSAGERKIRSGSRTALQAAIKGGMPPYSLAWTGAKGSGAGATIEAGKAGSQAVTVTVTDKAGGTAADTLAITVEAVPLAVTLRADKTDLLAGDSTALRATATDGTAPYRYIWTGVSKDAGETASYDAVRPGAAVVKVTAMDAWDNTGSAECALKTQPLTLRAEIAGVSGQPPLLWDEASHTLKPLPAGRYAEGQRVRVRAVVVGATLPAGFAFAWTAGSGGTLAGTANGAEAEVALTAKGTAEAGVTLSVKGTAVATASVKIPVEVSAADVAAAKKKAADWAREQENERRIKALLAEGYALERNKDYAGAIAKYKEAQALKNDPKVAAHIAELEKKMADLEKAKKLLAEGAALEKQGQLNEALAKYKASLSLDNNSGVQARITELEEKLARKAKASELIAQGYQNEQKQNWKSALANYESAQKEFFNPKVDERIAFVKNQMQAAAKQAADAQAAAQKAAANQLAADQARAEAEAVAAKKAQAAAWITKGYQYEQAQDWKNALTCYETAQTAAYNPKVDERIQFVKTQIQKAESKSASPPKPPAPAPSATPKPAAPVATPPPPASRYDLNGTYKGRVPLFEVNGQLVYGNGTLTVRQKGDSVSIQIQVVGPEGEPNTSTITGRIVGNRIETAEQKLRILDNGRTLVDEANTRFTR